MEGKAGMIGNGDHPIPGFRVRAVEADGALFVHLGDLIRYVQAADVPPEHRDTVASFLHQLGVNLESG